jgi:hypothetical protein
MYSNNTHCQACGDANPAHDEGYTECCNERVVDNGHCDNTCCHGKLVVAGPVRHTAKIRQVPITLPTGRRSVKYVVENERYDVISEHVFRDEAEAAAAKFNR